MINGVCVCVCAEATELVITNSSIPIQNENFTLTCAVNRSYEQIYWLKDNTRLNTSATNQTMSYHVENNTLHFTPVSSYDDGEYKCVAISHAGEHESPPFVLLVNCEHYTDECVITKCSKFT